MSNFSFSDASLYVACLESYNEGSLIGKWLKLSDYENASDFFKQIPSIIKGEEYAFHDFECFPNQFYHEYLSQEDVQKIYDFFDAISGIDENALEVYIDCYGLQDDPDAMIDHFNEVYVGYYENGLKDYAIELIQESYQIPKGLENYIDYKAYANDLDQDGYSSKNGYVFRP